MSLKQSLDLIKEGKVLVIYASTAMRAFVKDIDNLDLDKQEVVYLDCNNWPGLLGEGEWEWYLTQPSENSEIADNAVRKRLAKQEDIPNKVYYSH